MEYSAEKTKHVLEVALPEKPIVPLDSDCCGSGCKPCVFDIYEQELQIWQKECDKIQQNNIHGNNTHTKVLLQQDEYTSCKIISISEETDSCRRVRFQLPPGMALELRVGQHVILRYRSKYGRSSVTRQYTPVSPLDVKGYFEVIIKVYPDGKVSQVVKTWNTGDYAEWRGPFGEFSYTPNKYRRLVCLAAGTGLVPMVQVIRFILDNEDDETKIELHYCIQNYKDGILKPQLDEWTSYWNFVCYYYLSKEKPEDRIPHRYGDKIHYGRLTRDAVISHVTCDLGHTLVLICGTKSFEHDMLEYVKSTEISMENIHKF